jgi:hypothetical protein
MARDPPTEARARALTEETNRAIVSLLEAAGGSMDLEALARRLVDRDVTLVRGDEYDRQVERTAVSLHHERLPRLAELELVGYDADRKMVEVGAAVPTAVEWTADSVAEAILDQFEPDAGSEEQIGRVEGHEAVLQCGRRLADGASTELFCLYISRTLLEPACVESARRAIDRGVTIVLGSPDRDLRDLARSRLPEATVWEPQGDWWDDTSRSRVGRLVLADRCRVMLGIADQEPDGEHRVERALVGKGESHPLVVLVRDLLGPRLDHLDFQSEEFTGELPS